ALIPAELDNILGAGRHVACDPSSHSFLREIPQCWLTGHAAGIAAALSAAAGKPPREVSAGAVQRELLRQGAYLSPAVEQALRPAPAAEWAAKRGRLPPGAERTPGSGVCIA